MNEPAIDLGLRHFGSYEEITEAQARESGIDIMDTIRGRLADSMMAQLEAAIFECIDAREGPIWNPDEMPTRVRRIRYADHSYEDYTLDGVLMLRVWPVTIQREGLRLAARQDVQRFL